MEALVSKGLVVFFEANDRFIWECTGAVNTVLRYVLVVMYEPFNVWVAWVKPCGHDWCGVRFFGPDL